MITAGKLNDAQKYFQITLSLFKIMYLQLNIPIRYLPHYRKVDVDEQK